VENRPLKLFTKPSTLAIKSYQIEIGKEIEYERARENLEFLSQTGNKHPNLIRYFDRQDDGHFMFV